MLGPWPLRVRLLVGAQDPSTPREGREAIRDIEADIEHIHESPAAEQVLLVQWYLRKARLALRQAERTLASVDTDPDRLPALRPQISDRRPALNPPRRRYRCPECMEEILAHEDELPEHDQLHDLCCDGSFELVARLPRGHG